MQAPILNGIYADNSANLRVSYPRNLIPQVKSSGISNGYLRPADGIVDFENNGPGVGRGGLNWNGRCYRVMGTKLCRIDSGGGVTELGDVGSGGQVRIDYSFDRLAIASGGRLYYWDGAALTQVTDPDLGTVVDFVWIAGYFLTTDGTNLVVTELGDPTQVNPLKYGSAEVDPDPVVAVAELRNEAYALGRYSIEVFENIGGDLFPFQRIDGAQVPRGTLGTFTNCVFQGAIAFLGSGRNEAPGIWLASSGTSVKLSADDIDAMLLEYSEAELEGAIMECRVTLGMSILYLHLPGKTICYDANASQEVGQPVWFVLCSALNGEAQYRARNFVWCYDKWLVEDPQSTAQGYLTDSVSSHWGEEIGWEFNTAIIYNEGLSYIVHALELVALTGHVAHGSSPTIWASYSANGETWSQERPISAGRFGELAKRLVWLGQGMAKHWRIQKIRGTSAAFISLVRLEMRTEVLTV